MTDRPLPPARLAAALLAALLPAAALAGNTVAVSGSVYVDYWGIGDTAIAKASPAGMSPEAALKISVDVTDDVSFSAKACVSCHGVEMEHIQVEFMPSTRFNVQAGRLAIPFGEYANRIDPTGHVPTSAPLIYDMGRMAFGGRSAMNLGIIPLPYVDTGALVYGQVFLGPVQAWYGGYVVGGLRGGNDVDFIAMRSTPYNDNNRVPAGGGRVALTYGSEPGALFGDASLGGSATAGRYDKDGTLGYAAWGADASFKIWVLTFRGEYATRKTDLDPNVTYRYQLVDPWFRKQGWYAELEHPLGAWLKAAWRYDELQRQGVPLPGAAESFGTDERIRRGTAALVWTPAASVFAKLSWERWDGSDLGRFDSIHLGFGGAF